MGRFSYSLKFSSLKLIYSDKSTWNNFEPQQHISISLFATSWDLLLRTKPSPNEQHELNESKRATVNGQSYSNRINISGPVYFFIRMQIIHNFSMFITATIRFIVFASHLQFKQYT